MRVEFSSKKHDVADAWEWLELAYKQRWTDGLPVAPPTEAKVAEILEYLGEAPDKVIGIVPPRRGIATIEKIAINCLMAGCLPTHVPIVIAALKAMLEERFNLAGIQGTTNPGAPLTIVSGPVVRQLGFNYKDGVFGGGSRANAAVGRAVRLILWNIGGGYPGETDMATLGHPGKYCYCIAENLDDTPWEPLHAERGLDPDQGAVTVFFCDPPHATLTTGDPETILMIVAKSIARRGTNMFHAPGELLIVFAPRVARLLATSGWTKADIKHFLYEHARWNLGDLKKYRLMNEEDVLGTHWAIERPKWMVRFNDDQMLPMFSSPNQIHIVCTGGTGQWWSVACPGWGPYGGFAVTKPVEFPKKT